MSRLFSVGIIFLMATPNLSLPLLAQDGYERQSAIDVISYDYTLLLSDSTDVIKGSADIAIRFTASTQDLWLELANEDKNDLGMQLKEFSCKEADAGYEHQKNRINIHLPQKANAGDTIHFFMRYEGVPADGLYISQNQYGQRTFFGDNWPNRAHQWLPCIDHPSEKATVSFRVFSPYKYQVVANGRLVEETNWDDSYRLSHWEEKTPISMKIAVIGVAPFAVRYERDVAGIPLSSWVYNRNREAGFIDYAEAEKVLSYFISLLGPFPYEKLANVQSTTRYGGMENASCIFYNEKYISGKQDQEEILAHEIAHQWFGDYVTEKDWLHIWLSEGFATFMEAHYLEYSQGPAAYALKLTNDRDKIIGDSNTLKTPILLREIKNYNSLLNTNSYEKSGWILYMLRLKIGEEKFWKGLRNYLTKFAHANVLSQDFIQVMQESCGENLQNFFDQWLLQAGIPHLQISWSYNAMQKKILLQVNQRQDGRFNFPLEIGLLMEGEEKLSRTEVLDINVRNASFSFSVSAKPAKLIVDPYVKLLAQWKIEAE